MLGYLVIASLFIGAANSFTTCDDDFKKYFFSFHKKDVSFLLRMKLGSPYVIRDSSEGELKNLDPKPCVFIKLYDTTHLLQQTLETMYCVFSEHNNADCQGLNLTATMKPTLTGPAEMTYSYNGHDVSVNVIEIKRGFFVMYRCTTREGFPGELEGKIFTSKNKKFYRKRDTEKALQIYNKFGFPSHYTNPDNCEDSCYK